MHFSPLDIIFTIYIAGIFYFAWLHLLLLILRKWLKREEDDYIIDCDEKDDDEARVDVLEFSML